MAGDAHTVRVGLHKHRQKLELLFSSEVGSFALYYGHYGEGSREGLQNGKLFAPPPRISMDKTSRGCVSAPLTMSKTFPAPFFFFLTHPPPPTTYL